MVLVSRRGSWGFLDVRVLDVDANCTDHVYCAEPGQGFLELVAVEELIGDGAWTFGRRKGLGFWL